MISNTEQNCSDLIAKYSGEYTSYPFIIINSDLEIVYITYNAQKLVNDIKFNDSISDYFCEEKNTKIRLIKFEIRKNINCNAVVLPFDEKYNIIFLISYTVSAAGNYNKIKRELSSYFPQYQYTELDMIFVCIDSLMCNISKSVGEKILERYKEQLNLIIEILERIQKIVFPLAYENISLKRTYDMDLNFYFEAFIEKMKSLYNVDIRLNCNNIFCNPNNRAINLIEMNILFSVIQLSLDKVINIEVEHDKEYVTVHNITKINEKRIKSLDYTNDFSLIYHSRKDLIFDLFFASKAGSLNNCDVLYKCVKNELDIILKINCESREMILQSQSYDKFTSDDLKEDVKKYF